MSESIEIWKQIPDYEGKYSVSTFGCVRNDKTNRSLKPVKLHGYHRVKLRKPGEYKDLMVHRLVAIAFISNPLHKKDVDHKDRNRVNNHVENLRWATGSENNSNNHAKGCSFVTRVGRWRAKTTHNGKQIHIGYYATESEARSAYLAKAKELKGEFAQVAAGDEAHEAHTEQ